MALAIATCTCKTCGKTFEYRATKYNRREADSFVAWAVDHIDTCPDCKKAAAAAQRAADNAAAAADSAARNWPALTGSEKQIAWATTIRKEIIDKFASKMRPEYLDLYNTCAAELMAEKTAASWWIDMRYDTMAVFAAINDKAKAHVTANN